MSTIGTTVDSGNLPSRPFEGMLSEWTIRIDNQKNSLLNQCRHGFPPQSPYLGFSTPTLCYINKLETREAILEKELGSKTMLVAACVGDKIAIMMILPSTSL